MVNPGIELSRVFMELKMKANTIESPEELNRKSPLSVSAVQNVTASRQVIRNILDHVDPRLLIIVGPCSFHDPDANLEYASKLKALAAECAEHFYIVMRVYPEKARTGLGWKGYINDPNLDNGDAMVEGITKIRQFMSNLCEMGIPIATEILNPTAYLYYDHCLSWATIGARTVESQIHREIGSNLAIPIGFKNNVLGDIDVAINSIQFASRKQTFLGVNHFGCTQIINSSGNTYAHLVLRGGVDGPNYDPESIRRAEKHLTVAGLANSIIVDCSHGNSGKDYTKQPVVFNNVIEQKINCSNSIVGVMLESFLVAGRQSITFDKNMIRYGCSITDACLGWNETKDLIENAYQLFNQSIQLSV